MNAITKHPRQHLGASEKVDLKAVRLLLCLPLGVDAADVWF
jgi:hypothetical protein